MGKRTLRPRSSLGNDDDELVEVRTLVPRSELRVVEQVRQLTQHNALSVVGLLPSRFLLEAKGYAAEGGEVLRIGKLVAVNADAFLAWLRLRGMPAAANDDTDAEDVVDDQDDVAASLGFVRVATTKRRAS